MVSQQMLLVILMSVMTVMNVLGMVTGAKKQVLQSYGIFRFTQFGTNFFRGNGYGLIIN